MKVLGKTCDGFILQATESELGKLLGYAYSGDVSDELRKSGAEVKISPMFDQLYGLAKGRGKIKEAEKLLREYADLLAVVKPIEITVPKH